MIISSQKPLEEVLSYLEGKDTVYLLGCGECATTCHTGGEEDLKEYAKQLESKGKKVLGYSVLEAGCFDLGVKKELRTQKEKIDKTDAILVMSCGAGTQATSNVTDKAVFPGNNTHFLGNISRVGKFDERCSLCGECILAYTGGICPITRCAKGLLVGPCGGVNNGKCEVNSENDCAWVLIYKRMEDKGQLDMLKKLEPKNYSNSQKPGRIDITGSGQ